MIHTSHARHSTSAQVLARVTAHYPLTDGDAAAVASWYQTPRGHGATFATLASGLPVERDDLLDAVAAEIPLTSLADQPPLNALADWAGDADEWDADELS